MVARYRDDDVVSAVEPRRPALAIAPKPARGDALPEHMRYRDTGCELSASCLACPLSRCKYDRPGGVRRMTLESRDREIALLRRRHRAPINLLAATYGLSRRSVFRILATAAPRAAAAYDPEVA